jgi:hypothetical protein
MLALRTSHEETYSRVTDFSRLISTVVHHICRYIPSHYDLSQAGYHPFQKPVPSVETQM